MSQTDLVIFSVLSALAVFVAITLRNWNNQNVQMCAPVFTLQMSPFNKPFRELVFYYYYYIFYYNPDWLKWFPGLVKLMVPLIA